MDLLSLLMLDTVRKLSIVYPTSCGFAKVFRYHLFTEKPKSKKKPAENSKQFSSVISMEDFYPSFNIFNQALTMQNLNPTFERL